ncbi:MAG: DUF309 domain-containing protein [Desulfobacterales bacterium]
METGRAEERAASRRAFDPFGDRPSRDIRNTLSEAFVAAWRDHESNYTAVAEDLKRRHPDPVYKGYIDERLGRYRAALEDLRKTARPGLLEEVMILWNRGLFFEVHEVLEIDWHETRGVQREIRKTLIQAAGVYMHRESGRCQAAEKLGLKACTRLMDLKAHFKAIANLDELCRGLRSPDAAPPILRRL